MVEAFAVPVLLGRVEEAFLPEDLAVLLVAGEVPPEVGVGVVVALPPSSDPVVPTPLQVQQPAVD